MGNVDLQVYGGLAGNFDFIARVDSASEGIAYQLGWTKSKGIDRQYTFDASWGNMIRLGKYAKANSITFSYSNDPETVSHVHALREDYKRIMDAHKFRTMDEEELSDFWTQSEIDYLFPHIEFAEYQKRSILWLLQMRKGGCYFEQGLGKTMIALAYISKLIHDGVIKKPLLVAPPTLFSETAWFGEIKDHTNFDIVDLRKKKRKEPERQAIYVVNPELISRRAFRTTRMAKISYDKNNFIAIEDFDCIVFDESSLLGNPSALITRAMMKLMAKSEYVMLASGTPSPNSIFQIWAQSKILGSILGDSYGRFQEQYGHPMQVAIGKQVYKPRSGAIEEIRKVIDPVAYFLEREGNLELPPRHIVNIEVEMTPEHAELYKQVQDEYVAVVNGYDKDGNPLEGEIAIKHETVVRMKLLQIINGFVIQKNANDEDVFYCLPWNPKIERLKELIRTDLIDGDSNMIIWCRFRHEVETIYSMCEEMMPGMAAYIYGGMSDRKREQQLVKWIGDSSTRCVISHPQSTRFGHTWNKASKTCFFSATEDYGSFAQARDRNYRRGQTQEVSEYRFCTKGTVENQVWRAILDRSRVDRFLKQYVCEIWI